MTTAPRRRAVENRWIGRSGGIDSTGGAREHRRCSSKPRAPVSAAGVGVCGGGYPRVSQPRAFPTTPPLTICGYPTVQYRYPRTNLCACMYPLLLLRSHAATSVTLVRRKRTARKTPGDTTECGSGVYRVTA